VAEHHRQRRLRGFERRQDVLVGRQRSVGLPRAEACARCRESHGRPRERARRTREMAREPRVARGQQPTIRSRFRGQISFRKVLPSTYRTTITPGSL
jgi:hypothetical protein